MTGHDRTLTVDASDGGARKRSDRPAQPALLVLFSEGRVPGDHVVALPRGRDAGIGRQPDQLVFVEDRGMSRRHAEVARRGERFVVRDLGSHNGTFVDGARLEGEREVEAGAVIRCGTTLLMPVSDSGDYAGWPRSASRPPLLGAAAMRKIRDAIDVLAPQRIEVLLRGDSGTGKEVVARLLHQRSGRAGALVSINCAAVPEPLFEAELFGAVRGAYTGATAGRRGLFEQAHGGTLLLDEIGELPLTLQAKLLRAVEAGQVRPVGSDAPRRVDVRLVAATNRDLEVEVDAGRFRADLYFRLRGAQLALPPLRQRREDIALLAAHVLGASTPPRQLTATAVEALLLYRWPGNVRELERAVAEAAVNASIDGSETIELAHFKEAIARRDDRGGDRGDDVDRDSSDDAGGAGASDPRASAEVARLRRALEVAKGRVDHAAADLGISRSRLYRLLSAHGIRPKDFRER